MGGHRDDPEDDSAGSSPRVRGTPARDTRRRIRAARLLHLARFVLVAASAYLLLPRLAGLDREAQVLRHLEPVPVVGAVLMEAASLLVYMLFYQRVLAAMQQTVSFRVVLDVTLASFLVSHVAVGGSAAGVVTNVEAMGRAGVDREAAAEANGLASLFSSLGLLLVLAVGLGLSLRHEALPTQLLAVAAAVETVVVGSFVLVVVMARRPQAAETLGRWVGHTVLARRFVSDRAAHRLESAARRLSQRARGALSGPHFLRIMTPAVGELLLDAGALYLFFRALGYAAAPGSVLVAYGIANVLAAVPVTPAGLGVIEAGLTAVMVAYGAPAHVAVPAVLGYRLVSFWLPLPFGGAAYLHLRHVARS